MYTLGYYYSLTVFIFLLLYSSFLELEEGLFFLL